LLGSNYDINANRVSSAQRRLDAIKGSRNRRSFSATLGRDFALSLLADSERRGEIRLRIRSRLERRLGGRERENIDGQLAVLQEIFCELELGRVFVCRWHCGVRGWESMGVHETIDIALIFRRF